MKRTATLVSLCAILVLISCEEELILPDGKTYLSVSSNPTGAQIYIDDSLTEEKTNHVFEYIEPGNHTIRLQYYDWPEWSAAIEVKEAETTYVDAVLEPDTGEIYIKWTYEFTERWNSYTYPALGTDRTIYIGKSDGLLAIAPTGFLKWTYLTSTKIRITPSVGSDGTIYFGCEDSAFYAVRPDGSLKWKYKTDGMIRSSIALGFDGTIYFVSTDGNLYALNPDKSLKWKRNLGISDTAISPYLAIGQNGTIHVVYKSWISAVTPDNKLKWIFEASSEGSFCAPAIGFDGTIYLGSSDTYLYAVSSDGSLKWRWRYETDAPMNTAPSIDDNGNIYITAAIVHYEGPQYAYLYAVTPSGGLKWKKEFLWAECCPAIGIDGNIYVAGIDSGEASCFNVFNQEGLLVGHIKLPVVGGNNDNSIVIAPDGSVYVYSYDGIYAIQTSSRGLASSPWPKYGHDNQNTNRWGW